MLRRNGPWRNGTVTVRARVERMLGAPVTRSADGRPVGDVVAYNSTRIEVNVELFRCLLKIVFSSAPRPRSNR